MFRKTRSRWVRRAATTVAVAALAAGAAGAVGIADASTAHAFAPSCAYPPCTYQNILPLSNIDDGFYSPRNITPIYTPPDYSAINTARAFQQLKEALDAGVKLTEAFDSAKELIADPACANNWIGPLPPQISRPADQLETLKRDGKVVNKYDTLGPMTDTGPAIATGDPTGGITLYKDFFATGENSQMELGRKRFVPELTAEQWRTMVVLHELGHVYGKKHSDYSSDDAYEDALAKACFGSTKPPRPAQ